MYFLAFNVDVMMYTYSYSHTTICQYNFQPISVKQFTNFKF